VTDDTRLWHVTLTVAGAPMEPLIVRGALQRLTELRPFMSSIRFGPDKAELKYWDEADGLVDVASLALRLWNEYRADATLPSWEVVGLEVVEQELWRSRADVESLVELLVVPQPF
jgi:hypothetical protein